MTDKGGGVCQEHLALARILTIYGLIQSSSVQEPANASEITYSISYISSDGGIVSVSGQVPSGQRYRDFNEADQNGCKVVPLVAGQLVQGAMIDHRIYWNFAELPAIAGCPAGINPGMLLQRDPITGALLPIIPPLGGVPTDGSGGTAGGSIPAGGGGEGAGGI